MNQCKPEICREKQRDILYLDPRSCYVRASVNVYVHVICNCGVQPRVGHQPHKVHLSSGTCVYSANVEIGNSSLHREYTLSSSQFFNISSSDALTPFVFSLYKYFYNDCTHCGFKFLRI